MASLNETLEDFGFLTEEGDNVCVRDATTKNGVHFHAVAYTVDSIKILWAIKCVKLTKTNDFILYIFQFIFGNLHARKIFCRTRC